MQCMKHGIDTKQAVVVADRKARSSAGAREVHLPGLPAGQVEGLGTWVHARSGASASALTCERLRTSTRSCSARSS